MKRNLSLFVWVLLSVVFLQDCKKELKGSEEDALLLSALAETNDAVCNVSSNGTSIGTVTAIQATGVSLYLTGTALGTYTVAAARAPGLTTAKTITFHNLPASGVTLRAYSGSVCSFDLTNPVVASTSAITSSSSSGTTIYTIFTPGDYFFSVTAVSNAAGALIGNITVSIE
ncbi:hypothetical protein [Leptospira idonii]|uniref:Uncharacterized protein n=1 Tax=Leptospira idonii TaxID=1193500 RepID=A0A4R9M1W8_9LEPT|nr:hypothetical protein [Leptospira idonii]TGN20774.1 hypothetical protein EHS15_02645 [Leptospira idonii]